MPPRPSNGMEQTKKIKKKDAVYIDQPWLNNLLTVGFLGCVARSVYFLNSKGATQELQELGISFLAVWVLIYISKFMGKVLFDVLAPNIKTKKSKRKFSDQFWQLVIHASMGAYELYIMFGPEQGIEWFRDTKNLFIGPGGEYGVSGGIIQNRFFIFQVAIWTVTAISHRWIEEKHKDYYVMFAHHFVTIFLVTASWEFTTRIGIAVLLLHDLSDIGVDTLKLCNYVQSKFTTLVFVLNLISWVFFRLYVYPVYTVHAAIYESHPVCQYTETACYFMKVGLVVLEFMHIFWTYLFIRIAMKGVDHKAGAEVYEGDSDDEDTHED